MFVVPLPVSLRPILTSTSRLEEEATFITWGDEGGDNSDESLDDSEESQEELEEPELVLGDEKVTVEMRDKANRAKESERDK